MMKTLLLGSTALCAAVALSTPASAQVTVTVGGYMAQWFGWGDNDASAGNLQDVNTFTDGEIIFSFEGITDNGLTFGGEVQLEDNANSASGTTDVIDESYLFVSGDFGRVLIGSENGAGYLMQVASPNVGLPINSGSNTAFIVNTTNSNLFLSPFGSTYIEPALDNDAEKIAYFTPRFQGFQFGISYAPELIQDDVVQQTRVGRYVNGLSIGANYVGEFDGVEVSVAGGFYYAEQGAGFASVTNVAGVDTTDDFYGASAGITVSYQGFVAGFSYANVWSGVINTATATSTEGQGFDAGIAYTTGPLSFSLNGYYGEEENLYTVADDDTYLALQGSVRYELGQGIAVAGSLGWTDFDDEAAADNEGVYVTGGVLVEF
ncbi:MAG: porin [Rhodospirillaceae bacterium]|nr:porin [Rhodospirillaceae bacterium]MCA8930880.1 porin [Rhodospirillaceae bacterium]